MFFLALTPELPTTLLGLFIFVMVGVLTLLGAVVRSVIRRLEASDRQNVQVGTLLGNHFTEDVKVLREIYEHISTSNELLRDIKESSDEAKPFMARTASSLELIKDKLIDAVLIPTGSLKSVTVEKEK